MCCVFLVFTFKYFAIVGISTGRTASTNIEVSMKWVKIKF